MSYLIRASVARIIGARQTATPTRRAQALFEQFHCFRPQRLIRQQQTRVLPDVLVHLGELRGLIYRSDRGQHGQPRTFIHFFANNPLLASDPQGRQLYIVGGNYRINARGIEG